MRNSALKQIMKEEISPILRDNLETVCEIGCMLVLYNNRSGT